MGETLQLRLLGHPEIIRDGVSITEALPGKAQAILYYLAVTGQPQARATLATLLWGDVTDDAARANLRKALSHLRENVGDYLNLEGQTIDFRSDRSLWVDVVDFRANLEEVNVKGLKEAVALYRDDFLSGYYVRHAPDFESWLLAEQARLREMVIQALHTLAAHHAERGELAEGIAITRHLLSLEPWREEAHRQLITLLAQAGQRGAALAQYELCRQVLAEELDVEPGSETKRLYEQIRTGELSRITIPRGEVARKQESGGTLVPTLNLPPQPTSFVGREKELAEIRQLLLEEPACRMLTLVGAGGIGKTRLALAAAAEVVEAFPHSVHFVSLAPVGEAEFIISAIAETLKFNFSGSEEPKTQLLNYLHDRKLLLILDNFEHLMASPPEGGRELLSDILNAAPQIKLLVTSRERLNLQEEWSYEVQGMEFPPPRQRSPGVGEEAKASEAKAFEAYSAIQLFLQRARRANANFNLSAENIPHVVHICQLVEGMPLALELSAAWVRSLACQGIAQEIERNLDFLTSSMRNAPERHRSLRVVFEQTWQRLPEVEQQVLSKLSVFRGGCLHQAAEAVAGATLSILAALVDKALLRHTGSGRYEIHELLRQYAAEKLQQFGETETTRTAHAGHYAAFLRQGEADLKGGRQSKALAEIAAEIDNIRAGWQWAVERNHVETLRKFLGGLFLFYEMQGLAQAGETAFRRGAAAFRELNVADLDEKQTIAYGQLLGQQGNMALRTGRYEEGIELMRQGALLLRTVESEARAELAWTLCNLGEEIYFQGDYKQAQQFLQESLQLAAKADDNWLLGVIWQCLGQTAEFQGEYVAAETYFQQSLGAFEKLGELRAKSFTQNNWGRVAYATGEYTRAEQLIKAALQIREELQDKVGMAYSYLDLGKLATMRGAYEEARAEIERGLSICQEIGERDLMARCLNSLGAASRLLGNYAQAEAEHQQSLAIYDEIGVKREIPFTLNNLGWVAFDQGTYEQAQEQFQESLRLSQELENKAEMASALRHLGHGARIIGHEAEARGYYRQALETVIKSGAAPVALDIFLGCAMLINRNPIATNQEQALELLTLVHHHPATTHETREKARHALAKLAVTLPAEMPANIKGRSQALDWQSIAERLINGLASPDWDNPGPAT